VNGTNAVSAFQVLRFSGTFLPSSNCVSADCFSLPASSVQTKAPTLCRCPRTDNGTTGGQWSVPTRVEGNKTFHCFSYASWSIMCVSFARAKTPRTMSRTAGCATVRRGSFSTHLHRRTRERNQRERCFLHSVGCNIQYRHLSIIVRMKAALQEQCALR
jgi:hypothetical protein